MKSIKHGKEEQSDTCYKDSADEKNVWGEPDNHVELYQIITGDQDAYGKLSTIDSLYMPEEMKSVVHEVLTAAFQA